MFALFSVSPESLPANGNDLAGELIKRSIFRQAEIEPSLRDSGGRGGGGGRRGGRGRGEGEDALMNCRAVPLRDAKLEERMRGVGWLMCGHCDGILITTGSTAGNPAGFGART